MYIEDLILELSKTYHKITIWDQKVIDSFSDQIYQKNGFTEKQSQLALKFVNRYSGILSTILKNDVQQYITDPKFRLTIRKVIIARSLKIVDDPIKGKLIEAKFPYNEDMISQLRKHKDPGDSFVFWDKEKTAWMLTLNENNILFLSNLEGINDFDFDEEFQDYLSQISNIIEHMEKYIPTLELDQGIPKIVNSYKNMPEITLTDIVPAVFQARNFGVSTWSDEIENHIVTTIGDQQLIDFLKTPFGQPFNLDLQKNGVFCLEYILKYSGPTLFIIPGGSEFIKTQEIYSILHDFGIPNENMSVLFRLSSETGQNFNSFVKDHGLNSPISDNTQLVFVSGKIPKTVIKSGIKFNTIVNVGFENAHYSLKGYVKNHQNLVNVTMNKKDRMTKLVNM